MRPQIRELVERFEPALLWGDGHWGHSGRHWRSDQILADARAVAAERGFELVFNDRWFASQPRLRRVRVRRARRRRPTGAWELCRGLGYSFCVNRNERVEDHLTAAQVVALLVETVAKGGNLLLNVGPNADGTVPEHPGARCSATRARGCARTRRRSTDRRASTRPATGSTGTRAPAAQVHAFDLVVGGGAALRRARRRAPRCARPTAPSSRSGVDAGGLVGRRAGGDAHPFGTRYVVELATRERVAVVEPGPGGAARGGQALRRRSPRRSPVRSRATSVDVGPGRYTRAIGETFPLVVPGRRDAARRRARWRRAGW